MMSLVRNLNSESCGEIMKTNFLCGYKMSKIFKSAYVEQWIK